MSEQFVIRWPAFALPEVQTLVGLERESGPEVPHFSVRGRRIVQDLGLEHSPMLPHHIAAVHELANLTTDVQRHPFASVTAKQLPQMRELVGRLPSTPQALAFLKNTINGLLKPAL